MDFHGVRGRPIMLAIGPVPVVEAKSHGIRLGICAGTIALHPGDGAIQHLCLLGLVLAKRVRGVPTDSFASGVYLYFGRIIDLVTGPDVAPRLRAVANHFQHKPVHVVS